MNFVRRLQRRVLLVTDLSEGSMNALARAAFLCAQWECGLTILATKGNQAPVFSDAERAATRLEAGVDQDCMALVSKGKPAEALLDAAESLSADLITLGSRRRGGISRLLAGSTVAEVLRTDKCDILIVPGDEI